MPTPMTVQTPSPTGVVATYFGASGGTTDYYYWIQAIYPSGRSLLASSNLVTAVASFSQSNLILVTWNAMAGAIGYNVYRTATSTSPTVGTNFMASVTSNSFTDNGALAISAGQVIVDALRTARARYSFAVDGGGAPGLITLAQSDVIPKLAIMVGGYIKVTTNFATATNVGVGTSAGSSATSLIASTAIATLNTGTVTGVTPVVPTNATPVLMTADGTITITSTVAALTAGIMDIQVNYLMPLA